MTSLFPRHRDFAGTGDVADAERFHQFNECGDFGFVAGDLDGQRFVRDVHDLRPEDVANLHDFGPGLRVDADLDQHQLAIDIFAIAEILHLDHVHELVELLGDLFQHGVVALDHDGHPGGGRVLRRGDVEGVDIVAATAEQSRYAGQDTKFV